MSHEGNVVPDYLKKRLSLARSNLIFVLQECITKFFPPQVPISYVCTNSGSHKVQTVRPHVCSCLRRAFLLVLIKSRHGKREFEHEGMVFGSRFVCLTIFLKLGKDAIEQCNRDRRRSRRWTIEMECWYLFSLVRSELFWYPLLRGCSAWKMFVPISSSCGEIRVSCWRCELWRQAWQNSGDIEEKQKRYCQVCLYNGMIVHRHIPGAGVFTTMCRCRSFGIDENSFDNLFIGDNDSSSTSSRLVSSSSRVSSSGMETLQRTRASASTCSNACFFFSLIMSLRALTVFDTEISTGKTWLWSSPSTRQLSSRGSLEEDVWVTAKGMKRRSGELLVSTH